MANNKFSPSFVIDLQATNLRALASDHLLTLDMAPQLIQWSLLLDFKLYKNLARNLALVCKKTHCSLQTRNRWCVARLSLYVKTCINFISSGNKCASY